jgi:hypothetical protein
VKEKKTKPSDSLGLKDNMVKTAVFLRPDQIDSLKAIKDQDGIPLTVSIRKGIDLLISSRKPSK